MLGWRTYAGSPPDELMGSEVGGLGVFVDAGKVFILTYTGR
jgi:hypothetical protein